MMRDPRSLIMSKRRVGLFLDTNILLLLLVGQYVVDLISRFKRTQIFVPDDFELLTRVTALFERLVTSPQILSEVNSFVNQLREPARAGVLSVLASQVHSAAEEFVPAVKCVEHEEFARFGLADVATWTVCDSGPLLLTDDFRLSQVIAAHGVSVINFNHIRLAGWH